MRILLCEGTGHGFLSQYSHAVALGLHEAGHAVGLVTSPGDEFADWSPPYPKWSTLRPGALGWIRLARLVARVNPDLVHFQWIDNPWLALLFVQQMRRQGVATVFTPHNLLPHRARLWQMPGYRALYHSVDAVIARDQHVLWALEELFDLPRSAVHLLTGNPNLVAHAAVAGRRQPLLEAHPGNEMRLLYFGHGGASKGGGDLVAALARLPATSRLHLVLAGEAIRTGIDPNLLREVQTRHRVTLIDRYIANHEAAGLFTDCDLLVLPYRKVCKSPLLDLAADFALPVLRSDRVESGAFVEGGHGLTYAAADAGALERSLAGLVAAPGQLAALRAGMRQAAGCGAGRFASAQAALYRDILDRHPVTGAVTGSAL
jgi:glycosyltransferase involved in cell wall biosynthesis